MRLFQKLKKVDGCRAISFQDTSVCAVHVRHVPAAKPQVTQALLAPTGGTTEAAILGKLSQEWQGERYQCSTLLAAGEYQFLPVEAPQVPAAELKSAISWLVKDMLDFHVDHATIDVLNIPPEKNAPQRSRSLYAVAARSRVIEERQHQFEDAKIALRVIDIPEMAQRNIAALLEQEGRGLALLSFDERGGLLTITAGGELYVARRIEATHAQVLHPDAERKSMAHERVALEIQRSLDHFGRQYPSIALPKLVLAPMGDDDGDLQACLAENLDTQVEALDLAEVLDISATPDLKRLDRQRHYFQALGAALRVEEKTL